MNCVNCQETRNTETPATKKIAGEHFCKPCAKAIMQEVMRRGGTGKIGARIAIFRSNLK